MRTKEWKTDCKSPNGRKPLRHFSRNFGDEEVLYCCISCTFAGPLLRELLHSPKVGLLEIRSRVPVPCTIRISPLLCAVKLGQYLWRNHRNTLFGILCAKQLVEYDFLKNIFQIWDLRWKQAKRIFCRLFYFMKIGSRGVRGSGGGRIMTHLMKLSNPCLRSSFYIVDKHDISNTAIINNWRVDSSCSQLPWLKPICTPWTKDNQTTSGIWLGYTLV